MKNIAEVNRIDKLLQYDTGAAGREGIEMMLAQKYEPNVHNPHGWLMSEKLDGVRCYWDTQKMVTRNGNAFYPPDWFIKELPKDMALDGELFTKRDDF